MDYEKIFADVRDYILKKFPMFRASHKIKKEGRDMELDMELDMILSYLGRCVAHFNLSNLTSKIACMRYKQVSTFCKSPEERFPAYTELTPEYLDEFLEILEFSLEYQHHLLLKRVEKLEKEVEELQYAPPPNGGPAYMKIEAEFADKVKGIN
ncbi:hypothetical protein BNJ_00322 [Kaumoebavirus]|uniref:hypothetical protein n=1 Tax=Kaumoebavirus TaxID=1859492 RepID=UPI0009C37AB3|nr:hypothetical protein BNJ_00322 [Kaumoebavirus]ARA72144.1 hypothetical protein BNJ_00322 [Kaumoebavirus]